jgi:CRISP-associated protein Cas1
MPRQDTQAVEADDLDWRDRCEYWRAYEPKRGKGPRPKYNYRQPLVLCGHGAKIRIDHDTLLVRNGLTHYPQKSEEIRYFPGDANLPDRIIVLDGSGGISFDAINWMSDQNIVLVQLDWRGRTVVVGGNSGYSANPQLVAAQRAIKSGKRQIEIARRLIQEKITASLETLMEVIPCSEIRDVGISQLRKFISESRNSGKLISVSKIHGIEGGAAAAYFQAWCGLTFKWSGLNRRPIPDGWLGVGSRTMGWRRSSQNARHPLNAMLNYGYGILVSQLRTEIVAAGLDPSIGIMHGNSENRIPLVYDLMEPLRPVVDRKILQFALAHIFKPGDFTINRFGGCRLNPQMGRAVVTAIDIRGDNVVSDFRKQLRV